MASNDNYLTCQKCGAKLRENAEFCAACGNEVNIMKKNVNDTDESNNNKLSEFSEDSLRQIAKEIVIRRTSLKIHWYAFIGVNILLFSINFLVDYSYQWHLWPLISWSMGLIIHSFNFIVFKKGLLTTTEKQLLGYHTIISLLISPYLIWIDWFTSPNLGWWYWAVIPILVILVIHFVIFNFHKPKKGENEKKGYIDRKIDKELSKIKNE